MSYCKICIENDKKKKRLFDLFTDKFKCEDEGRFLYRCKDCWQYSLALYSYVYINKEKCDNFSYKKWCLKGLRRQFCTKTFVSVQKKHINLALCSCWLTNRIVVTSDHFNKSLPVSKDTIYQVCLIQKIIKIVQAVLTPRLHIISDTRIVF